ncbi:hypothetical protein L484_004560 [Morus notabilis]|uniref:Uncharacterized protein n=1 Tax=Morus notabilis TaxID=981085 RepID=W9QCA1_9ROSA|nr:hypothetical protein L484_004560 [Morus notabilis]
MEDGNGGTQAMSGGLRISGDVDCWHLEQNDARNFRAKEIYRKRENLKMHEGKIEKMKRESGKTFWIYSIKLPYFVSTAEIKSQWMAKIGSVTPHRDVALRNAPRLWCPAHVFLTWTPTANRLKHATWDARMEASQQATC